MKRKKKEEEEKEEEEEEESLETKSGGARMFEWEMTP